LLHPDKRQVRKWAYKVIRPSSYPYISGDGFRKVAKHVYDETNQWVPPHGVRDGDLIFVSTDHALGFFRDVDPQITTRYRLITHNSDKPVDQSMVALATDKIQVWFAQNDTAEHEKVIPIPIGLENLHHYHAGVPEHFNALRKQSGPRQNKILAGFTIGTNRGERQRVHEIASQAPCVFQLPQRLGQLEYLKNLVTYKFLLSPPGNGVDTHRTWEAMYLGVVPIVKDSVAMRSFRKRGLPMWIIESWDDLLLVREKDLERKYEQLACDFRSPALFMDYWQEVLRGSSATSEETRGSQ
jgi:hypothetical protein